MLEFGLGDGRLRHQAAFSKRRETWREGDNRERAARDADELSGLIADVHGPDLGGPADVNGDGRSGEDAVSLGTQVVGVDLLTQSHHPVGAVEVGAG